MSSYTIHVAGLAAETSEEKLHDFFSFCGKLTSVKKSGTEADITFEKQSAMRTALMLNGGTLDGAHLEVTAKTPEAEPAAKSPGGAASPSAADHHIEQEDKPKAAIAAEYLASGYILGDNILQKAIDVDKRQGISSRFLSFLGNIDKKAGEKLVGENKTVSAKALEHANTLVTKTREADQQHGVSSRFHQYYTKALGTPMGQKVAQFYHEGAQTAVEIHEEAKRIAAQKKGTSGAATPVAAASAAPAAASPVSAPVNAEVEAKEAAQAAAATAAPAAANPPGYSEKN